MPTARLASIVVLIAATAILHVAYATSGPASDYNLIIVFMKPVDESTWSMKIMLEGVDVDIECIGVLRPNAYYVQTRGISSSIVVAPLYYILDSVCHSALSEIQLLATVHGNRSIRVVVSAPKGYIVRSSLDWRGYGPLGGPYTVDVVSFVKHYVFDGIVVANVSAYRVEDLGHTNITVVAAHGIGGEIVKYVVESVTVVRSALSRWLGPSPRAPVVVAIVGANEHYFQPPGSAHSLGGVVYLKIDSSQIDEISWLVHTVAHEAVHGWFNHGMLYGDFSFQEAAAEFLALKALHDTSPELYEKAASYLRIMLEAGEQYAVWMRVNAALWYAGVKACNEDLYMRAISILYNASLAGEHKKPVSLLDIARIMHSEAPFQCKGRLEAAMGKVFEAASRSVVDWPFIDTEVFRAENATSKKAGEYMVLSPQNATDTHSYVERAGYSSVAREAEGDTCTRAALVHSSNAGSNATASVVGGDTTYTPCLPSAHSAERVYVFALGLGAGLLAGFTLKGLYSRRK
ncbi:MAG TPA: hypothetical protein EYH50_00630 [Pyrodictium delaneyi]|uniref:Peptidase M1 membrane alanine aminopeptidase domain-containing protein n=1 Tax=Pyrodictium delaneyi TaxID=1273541 RepID=A0A833EAE7_9CREN|nr:hypothetical protein [Pyrodictium delaneyi]